jgi:hypothetical protein
MQANGAGGCIVVSVAEVGGGLALETMRSLPVPKKNPSRESQSRPRLEKYKVTALLQGFGRRLGRLNSPREGQRRRIITVGSNVHEVLHALQDAMRKIFGRSWARLQDVPDSVQPKFRVLGLRLDDAA